MHNHITRFLDEYAPFRKLKKKRIKLKGKPWITKEILYRMSQRDKVFSRYNKAKDNDNKEILYHQYKKLRNDLTKIQRDSKIKYYKNYFEINKKKTSVIWEGIRSLVNIKPPNKTVITSLDSEGKSISDLIKIANC